MIEMAIMVASSGAPRILSGAILGNGGFSAIREMVELEGQLYTALS
jgi:hypothetical protein